MEISAKLAPRRDLAAATNTQVSNTTRIGRSGISKNDRHHFPLMTHKGLPTEHGRLPGSGKEVSRDIARFKPLEEYDTATVGKRSRGRRNADVHAHPPQLRPVTA